MITNLTAYNIGGEYYLHRGKPNGNTKKKIQRLIEENKEAQKKIHCYSFVDGWEKTETSKTRESNNNQSKTKKITNKQKEKISWQQLTLPL
tara:strand:- start:318 stop:590 length:273 start_codon:yes stop_codon:yes gene_type:complete